VRVIYVNTRLSFSISEVDESSRESGRYGYLELGISSITLV